jgi:very-short-patch-repair endonuclease
LLAGEKLTVEALVSAGRYEEGSDPNVRTRTESEARQKVRSALVAIQRKALSNLEEKGIETLHLAMGLATWPASDGGRPYDAPVLLLPARIEARGRAGDDLRLAVAGEPKVNPVLLYVLEENHGVRIDASAVLRECGSEDQFGQWRIEPEKMFERIGHAAASVSDFRVRRRVILANFQFAKMAMVEDLKRNSDTIASSAIVAAVAGHFPARQKLGQAASDITPAQLDELPAAKDYLVLDADSSQQRAIVLVSNGQNGVVQGPPGTGKSQTIANLIAQSVAEGRRVLFVAEKRAALEAVIKRLRHSEVGLGHLLLDLHGASVSRKEVMARLADALERIHTSLPVNGAESVHLEFEAQRKRLNAHVRRVNQPRQPTGLSVYQMVGRLLRLPPTAKSDLRLHGEAFAALTAERATEVKQWIIEAAAAATLFLGTDRSPWNNADIKDGRRAQEAVALAVKAVNELWPEFERLLDQVVSKLGMRRPNTLNDVASLLAVLRDARSIRQRYRAEFFSAGPSELATALEPAEGNWIVRAWALLTNPSYRAARNRLLDLRVAPAPSSTLRYEAVQAADILQRWQAHAPSSAVPEMKGAEADLGAAFDALNEVIQKLEAMTESGPFASMLLSDLASRLQAFADDRQTAFRLPSIYMLRTRLSDAGLGGFVDSLRKRNVPPEHWSAQFEYVWLSSALEHAYASDPALASFNGRTHEQVIEEFRRLDRERVRLAAQRVRRLHAERAIEAMNNYPDQADFLRKETAKKARHVPLRELLARAPDVLTRVAPCWVASPLSVSQLLDGSRRHFDLVVFDEASQILQEEAIPALYRAEQVVVAGDRYQLPPTTFFATTIEDEVDSSEEEERSAGAIVAESISGFESLLDTLQAFLPNWHLEWHYRSEDERLITFSNAHVYDGRLITFPSARGQEAIRHILVPHDPALGGQEESASREVEEVVRQVIMHAETRPNESLGVITMGIRHANRIQAALDRALENRPELSDFFSLDREERFFVKNLETVQGDERDAIILSIGYGKTANGDLPHRFGPLTQDAGYRRLNVAITRAKRRMCVISSFSHDEIDLSRSGSRGVQLLKAYLEYAASDGTRFPESERAGEVSLNPFEADVRDALGSRGIKTRPQFGASRYRIDLVAMHPKKPGRPVLAIECDGASYHSSATARDRDRLRQAHLQRLGWRFHRIWSTDWFYHREQEIERAVAAFEEAVRWADALDADERSSETESNAQLTRKDQQPAPARRRGPRPLVAVRNTIDQYSDHELWQIADWIMSDGLLRTDEQLIAEIFQELPFERLGKRIRSRLKTIVAGIGHARKTRNVPR